MLNSYEQQLLGVVNGTFEYGGELYKVQPSYINMLESKLNQANVDLTADQANQVISKIFSNVEEGVRQNILKKVEGEEKKEAQKEGNTRKVEEAKITEKKSSKKKSSKQKSSKQNSPAKEEKETEQEVSTVVGRDGNSYPVQTTPIDTTKLSGIDYDEIVTNQNYTPDEQIVSQLSKQKMQVFSTMFVVWVVGLLTVCVYLKAIKHKKKARFVLLGAGAASLSILVIGSIFLYCGRAYSTDAWHTAALESGYFEECSHQATEGVKKILTSVGVEADVSILGFTEQVVYRDAKAIFSFRIEGKGTPLLKKRTDSVREMLQKLLPKESVEKVERLSEAIMRQYKNQLDTPYATCLYQLKKEHTVKSVTATVVAIMTLLGSVVFIWKGSRYPHRRFRGMAYGIGIAGFAFVIAGGWQVWKMPQMTMQPLVYRLLFEQYVDWLNKNVLYFGILLLCLSLFTWCASYVTKKNHIQKIHFE